MELKFEPSFFEGEEREGFYVKPMMKKVWAAQLEVLKEIDTICKRHNIMYYAEYGTLLGAVRHGGFIPWDDDMDIGMLRKDYVRFLGIAQKELPKGYKVLHPTTCSTQKDLLIRVVNNTAITADPAFLKRYHGCPYSVGIDIFPSDNIPKNKGEEQLLVNLLSAADVLGRNWDEYDMPEEEKWECVRELEEYCNIKFNDTQPIKQQLLILSDRLCAMYWDETPDEITLMPKLASNPNYRLPASCYDYTIEVPFENTTVPIPVGYDSILTRRYGDYMTPVRRYAHNYPFYREQEDILFKYFTDRGMPIPEEFLE